MKFVFLSYINTPAFKKPEDWIKRIRGYTGVLEALARQHDVVSIEQINYKGIFLYNGVAYHFLDFGKGKLTFPRRLHQHVKKQNPDVVFVHGMHFPLQVMQLRMVLGNKTKIIVQNHAEKPAHGIKRYLQQLADGSIDAYLFASKEMGDAWLKKKIISRQIKVREVMEASSFFIPVNREYAKVHTGVSGHPVFLWVGRLDLNKDPLTVISGFLKFKLEVPSAHLYMIFHTVELIAEIKALLENNAAKNEVILSGEKTHEEMMQWYNAADYIISGSHYEGSGVAVCEAMSCGCIPVLTDIPSFRKITDNGNCGILYEAGNEKALLKALKEITGVNSQKEREQVIRQFNAHLSFEAIARDINQVVNTLNLKIVH
jgi:glycosyltransferase involved in cell wall biosynthesis